MSQYDSCPDCGGPKTLLAERCSRCSAIANGRPPKPQVGSRNTDETPMSASKTESICTFRNTRTDAVRTLHVHGQGVKAQIDNGLAILADDEGSSEDWTLECRSTPTSILTDLRGRAAKGRPRD